MLRTKRQELFWLGLVALCIALFVAHRMKEQTAGYDTQSMDVLVKQSWQTSSSDPDADLVTGSLSAAPHKYFVSFGSFDSIEIATKRYLDVLSREPQLSNEESVTIDTWQSTEGEMHRVRMGEFNSAWAARSTCLKAGFSNSDCKVLATP